MWTIHNCTCSLQIMFNVHVSEFYYYLSVVFQMTTLCVTHELIQLFLSIQLLYRVEIRGAIAHCTLQSLFAAYKTVTIIPFWTFHCLNKTNIFHMPGMFSVRRVCLVFMYGFLYHVYSVSFERTQFKVHIALITYATHCMRNIFARTKIIINGSLFGNHVSTVLFSSIF